MTSEQAQAAALPTTPVGPRYDLLPPVGASDDRPTVVVTHDGLNVSAADTQLAVVPIDRLGVGEMTPYGGSLAGVSQSLGDDW